MYLVMHKEKTKAWKYNLKFFLGIETGSTEVYRCSQDRVACDELHPRLLKVLYSIKYLSHLLK
jgi:hypothetical protein